MRSSQTASAPPTSFHQRRVSRACLQLVCALGLVSLLLGRPGPSEAVLACGVVGGPTMLANEQAAIPSTDPFSRSPSWTPGLFPVPFRVGTPIRFAERIPPALLPVPDHSLRVRWTLGDGTVLTGQHIAHAWARPGTYRVWSQFWDPSGATWRVLDGVTLQVARPPTEPPLVYVQASTQATTLGVPIQFSSQGTRAQRGRLRTLRWNFGDGQGSDAAQPTHAFTQEGTSTVTLIATDSSGGVSVGTLAITLHRLLPVSTLLVTPSEPEVGDLIVFDASSSLPSRPDTTLLAYQWNFGDGSPLLARSVAHVAHRYAQPGTYTLTQKVSDSAAEVGVSVTILTVHARRPLPPGFLWCAGVLVALGGFFSGWFWLLGRHARRRAPRARAHEKGFR